MWFSTAKTLAFSIFSDRVFYFENMLKVYLYSQGVWSEDDAKKIWSYSVIAKILTALVSYHALWYH